MLSDGLRRAARVQLDPVTFTLVQGINVAGSSGVTSSASLQAGDIAIAYSHYYSNSVPAAPSGFTTIAAQKYATYQAFHLSYKVLTDASAITVNQGNDYNGLIIFRPSRIGTVYIYNSNYLLNLTSQCVVTLPADQCVWAAFGSTTTSTSASFGFASGTTTLTLTTQGRGGYRILNTSGHGVASMYNTASGTFEISAGVSFYSQ